MQAQADEYAFAFAVGKTPDLGLADTFMRKHEVLESMTERIVDALREFNVDNYVDGRELAIRLFDIIRADSGFSIISDEVAGEYFKILPDIFRSSRSRFCNESTILQRASMVGARFWPEVFNAFETKISSGEWNTTPESTNLSPSGKIESIVIPASDRIVSLHHNTPEYQDITAGLEDAVEQVNALKTNELSGDEKSRAVATLQSVSALFRAGELKVVQVKVGIILALEDVERLTGLNFKTVAGTLLLEAIKSLFAKWAPGLFN